MQHNHRSTTVKSPSRRKLKFRKSGRDPIGQWPAPFAQLNRQSRTAVGVWLALVFLAHEELGRRQAAAQDDRSRPAAPPRRLHVTRKQIASAAGLQRLGTVSDALRQLEAAGWIKIYYGAIKNGEQWIGQAIRIDVEVDIAKVLAAHEERGREIARRAAQAAAEAE